MRKCRKCGAELQPTSNYCGVCGERWLGEENAHSQVAQEPMNKMVVICVLAVALIAGGFLGYRMKSEKEAEPTEPAIIQDTQQVRETEEILKATEAPVDQTAETAAPHVVTPAQTESAYVVHQDPLMNFVENCDKVYMTWDDVAGFDEWACVLAKNACYAKSGRMFNDYRLQEFFGQFAWYEPTISPSSFSDALLNDYQLANIGLILEYEQRFK